MGPDKKRISCDSQLANLWAVPVGKYLSNKVLSSKTRLYCARFSHIKYKLKYQSFKLLEGAVDACLALTPSYEISKLASSEDLKKS